ncbi:MAG: hypothetical protein OXC13_15960 [Caldilineaceae bacterium]|nr:hypothetical protein [Caldilineaceae bacterium]
MTRPSEQAAGRHRVATERLEASWRALCAPVVPARLIDFYRRGVGVCWVWLSVGFSLGISGWNLYRAPVLWQEHGVRIPWPGTAWVPVWSPVPGQGMAWILIPMLLGGLLLLAELGPPRPIAAVLLGLGLWLLAADRVLFLYHRYLIMHMTLTLLLPGRDADSRVSQLDCLPVIGLALAMWSWSAVAKIAWEWPVIWGTQLQNFGPPVVDAAVAWLFDRLPRMQAFLIGAALTAVAEIFVAVCLGWPRGTRAARYAGLWLCGGFALLAPLFAVGAGVTTWTAGRCVEAGRARVRQQDRQPGRGLPPNLRHLAILAFLVFHVAPPVRTYLLPERHVTHLGSRWAWRQMSDSRPGLLKVEAYDPDREAWQDLTPAWHKAHPDIVRQLTVEPCEIAWALAWLARRHPELAPLDRLLRLSLPPTDPPEAPVPAACADELPPHVRQVGRVR